MYKISPMTLKRWVDTNNIVCQKISSKKFLYHIPESDIDYLENAARIPVFIPNKEINFDLKIINDAYHRIYPEQNLVLFYNEHIIRMFANKIDDLLSMKAIIIIGDISDFSWSKELTTILKQVSIKRIPIWTYSIKVDSFEKYIEINDFFAEQEECGNKEFIGLPDRHEWENAYKRPYNKAKLVSINNDMKSCKMLENIAYFNPDVLNLNDEQKKTYEKICEYHDVIIIEK